MLDTSDRGAMTHMAEKDPFRQIFDEIKADPQNAEFTERGIDPLYSVGPEATIAVIGQAPGRIAQDTGIVWNDKSGDRLRDWLGVSREEFYESGRFAIVPMDFYFPGTGRSGDLPPRKGFAEKWHPRLWELTPRIGLTVLVGNYANRHYLGLRSKDTLTNVVRNFRDYLPTYLPLVHPSPRNQMWMARNPWFEEDVLPELRQRVRALL